MNKLWRPSLARVFQLGLGDFYALLAVGVCTIIGLPGHVLTALWCVLATIFILSALVTLSGIYWGKLYREFEAISVLLLQVGLAVVSLLVAL